MKKEDRNGKKTGCVLSAQCLHTVCADLKYKMRAEKQQWNEKEKWIQKRDSSKMRTSMIL